MKKIILISILFFLILLKANGQNFEVNTKSYYGLWNKASSGYFYGGGGLELSYNYPINKGAIQSGIEFRSINWGNQISLQVGYNASYLNREKWSLNGVSSVGVGFALFHDNPLFVWSIDYTPEFILLKHKKLNIGVGIGVRYTHSPAYKDYGAINQVFEMPIRLGFKFNIASSQNEL